MKKRTIFFGTPEVAVPFLEVLNKVTDIALVVTQPDKPRGRGMEVSPCPVKAKAIELGLKVLSPQTVAQIEGDILAANADYAIIVAYGKLLKRHVIDMPALGMINIHFSLLPHLRGAAPVQRALFNGDVKTGVSAFWIDEGMDTGPLFLQQESAIDPKDNARTLFTKLINLGCAMIEDIAKKIENNDIQKIPQTGAPTHAGFINKEDTIVNFADMPAAAINNRVRGLACGPCAKARLNSPSKEEYVQILEAELPPGQAADVAARPRAVISVERERGLIVKCLEGCLAIKKVRPAGKKEMHAYDYANGRQLKKGDEPFL